MRALLALWLKEWLVLSRDVHGLVAQRALRELHEDLF